MADGTEGLLRWENEVMDAMMRVRYALDAQEAPKAAYLDIIRTNSLAFCRLAERIHKQHVQEEEDYQRREHGSG